MKKIIFYTGFALLTFSCKAQTNELTEIAADRPGMATPANIVQAKCFQLETGFSYEKIRTAGFWQENFLYNTSLLRYGINQNAEIRMQTDYAGVIADSINISGFDPLTIGTKLVVTQGKSFVPQTSFLVNFTLPYFGEKSFRPENIAPSFYLLMQNDISDKLNLCYNIGLEYDGSGASPSVFAALCLGYSFSGKLSGFIENYDWFSSIAAPQNFVDYGFAYLLRKNLQLDISANSDLHDFENYFMINFGISWRVPR